jgi:hypothetical protein
MSEILTENFFFDINSKRAKSSQMRIGNNNSLSYSSYNNINNKNKINEIFNSNKSSSRERKIIYDKVEEKYSNNLCKEKNCLNIYIILKLQSEIKELAEGYKNLKKINECLLNNINLKNDKLIELNSTNKNLKLDNNLLNKHINSKSKNEKFNLINQKDSINITNYNSKNIFMNSNINNSNNVNDINPKFRAKSSYRKENFSGKVKYLLKMPDSKNEIISINKNIDEKNISSIINKENRIDNDNKNSNNNNDNYNNKENLSTISFSNFKFGMETNNNKQILNKDASKTLKISYDVNTNNNNPIADKIINILPNKPISSNLKSIKKNNNNNIDSNKSNNFYERISSLINNNDKPLIKPQIRKSIYSLSDIQIDKLITNDVYSNLKKICNNEDDFIDFFKNATEDIMVSYCDKIFKIIKDLETSLILLKRMRNYVNITSVVSNNPAFTDILSNLIRDAIGIMECDRVSIFIYDSSRDMLVLNLGEGLRRNEIKISKNLGIVGASFTSGEIIRVDDCYADERFDRTFDRKLNYVTNNLIAAPIKDRNNNICGVVECTNKKQGKFTQDDEIIIQLFSFHISKILIGAKTMDENCSHISKLKTIISIKDSWCNIKSLIEFSCDLDNTLMSIFSINNSQFYFYNKKKKNLIKIGKYDFTIKSLNIGIIGYVYASGKFYGTSSSNSSEFYNQIIDIECGLSILTYPVKINNEIKGILQFSYNDKLIENKNTPLENDEIIINYLLNEVEKWILLNQNVIDEYLEKKIY